jgi:CheY-like chemotaxis protein
MAPVVYLVRDLVFVSKIHETATRLGLEVERAADAAALHTAAREAKLVIVDLRLPEAVDALARLASDPATARVRAVGFVDHQQVEAMAARVRGTVLAKGRFASELPSLLAGCRG